MARSDTVAPTEVRWDPAQRRWVGDGTRGASLARVSRGLDVIPAGKVVDDIIKARVVREATERRLAQDTHRWKQHLAEAVTRLGMSTSDVAILAGVSKQRVHQIIEEMS